MIIINLSFHGEAGKECQYARRGGKRLEAAASAHHHEFADPPKIEKMPHCFL